MDESQLASSLSSESDARFLAATFGTLLAEAAIAADLEAVVQHDEAGEWELVFGDHRVVEAKLLCDCSMVVLETELGTPESRDVAALHKLLLEYNYLWRETGGLRVSLDAPRSSAFLTYTLAARGPDASLLANVLGNFHAAATAWAELLVRPSGALGPESLPTGAIRI